MTEYHYIVQPDFSQEKESLSKHTQIAQHAEELQTDKEQAESSACRFDYFGYKQLSEKENSQFIQ